MKSERINVFTDRLFRSACSTNATGYDVYLATSNPPTTKVSALLVIPAGIPSQNTFKKDTLLTALNGGGPEVRVETTNGGVRIRPR